MFLLNSFSITEIRDLITQSYTLAETYRSLSPAHTLTSLGVAFVCGMMIYFVYRFFHRGVVFSESYNILLVLVTISTSFIINTISVNIVLSLGMVGALSIVRFRAAIKDPLDVGFLFYGVSAGITAGAGLYFTALLGTGAIAIAYMALTIVKKEKKSYLLIVKYNEDAEPSVEKLLSAMKYKVKNKTQKASLIDFTVELKIVKNDTSMVKKCSALNGVESATLLEYSGEYLQ